MFSISRRKFLSDSGTVAIGSGLTTFASNSISGMTAKNIFIHHVYFWLNNPDSKEDLEALKKGLQKLSTVKNLKMFHIGKPADTNREVIDRSYALSWFTMFENAEEQQ